MPIEIRRFGVGQRRPDGPPGTSGVSGQVIHTDGRGAIAELAFSLGARMEPHVNPNPSWFVVIEGGGWVGVGDERTRVAAGEAILFPADVPHAAWTEHSQMRAFTVEFSGRIEPIAVELSGAAAEALISARRDAAEDSTRADGGLAADASGSVVFDPTAGEPM